MTIQESIKKSLSDLQTPMNANEILSHIKKRNYYMFKAEDPIKVIYPELSTLIKNKEIKRTKDKNNIYRYTSKR